MRKHIFIKVRDEEEYDSSSYRTFEGIYKDIQNTIEQKGIEVFEKKIFTLLKWYIFHINVISPTSYDDLYQGYGYINALIIAWAEFNKDNTSLFTYDLNSTKYITLSNSRKVSHYIYKGTNLSIFDTQYSLHSVLNRLLRDYFLSYNSCYIVDYIKKTNYKYHIYQERLVNKKEQRLKEDIELNLIKQINKLFPCSKDLIKLWGEVFILRYRSLESILEYLDIKSRTCFIRYKYYEKHLLFKYLISFAKENKLNQMYDNDKRKIDFICFYHDGEDNLRDKIQNYWEIEKLNSKQIAEKLKVNLSVFHNLINALKLQYPGKKYFDDKMLIDPDEKFIELLFQEQKIEHIWQPRKEQYEFSYYDGSKKRLYKPDWIIQINGQKCVIELFKNNNDIRTRKKIEYFTKLDSFKFIALYKQESQNPELILKKIEATLNTEIKKR